MEIEIKTIKEYNILFTEDEKNELCKEIGNIKSLSDCPTLKKLADFLI